jgi:c(7)-type cytochrome triheme protein
MRYYLGAVAGVCLLMTGCSNTGQAPQTSTSATPPAASTPAPASPPPVAANATAEPGTPPETIEFTSSRDGNVIFTHKKHYERVNGDCTTCHTKIFPQSREAINYGKALHRAAEAKRTACAACHAIGGTAFAADSNCPKCHLMRPRR